MEIQIDLDWFHKAIQKKGRIQFQTMNQQSVFKWGKLRFSRCDNDMKTSVFKLSADVYDGRKGDQACIGKGVKLDVGRVLDMV